MSDANCVPYGAFELKATYQRNLLLGNLIVFSLVIAVLATAWLLSRHRPVVVAAPVEEVVSKPLEWKQFNPESIKRDLTRPADAGAAVPEAARGIPVPMPDSAIADPDAVIMSQADRAALIDWNGVAGEGQPGPMVIDENVGILPEINDFVYAESPAEFVTTVQPDYPRFAEAAGIEGDVWIKALVSREGKVLEAVVVTSSGSDALDEAARVAAFRNAFKPALQNGVPVAIWVTYKVEFELED